MRTAHEVGFRSTATIMFGHIERYEHWARHLLRVRDLQAETGGLHGVCAAAVRSHGSADLSQRTCATGTDIPRRILMHAVARLVLNPHIKNIQASWVKLGPKDRGAARRRVSTISAAR